MPLVNLSNINLTGPSTFAAAGAEQTLSLPYSITISGGVLLGSETNLSVEDPTVYGTAAAFDSLTPGPGLTNPLTISFQQPVTSFSVEIFNGYPATVTYTLSDNNGDNETVSLPPNNASDAAAIILPISTNASSFTITSSQSPWDFSIDNIAFDFTGPVAQIPKNHSIADHVTFFGGTASAYWSVYAAVAAPETAGTSLLGDVFEFALNAVNAVGGFAYLDPFDSNYAEEYNPTFQSVPTIQADSVITPAFADDANTALADGSKSISYMQAMYVSLNRYNSALQVGDTASIALQDVALTTYLSLASSSLNAFSMDLTKLSNDVSSLVQNTAITAPEVASFISAVQSGGFGALPQEEQTLFNTYGFSANEEQSVANLIGSIDPSSVPLSMSAALTTGAAEIASLAAIYGSVDVLSCFAEGTRILTSKGEKPVENIIIGSDQVVLHSGALMPVKWLAYRRVHCGRHPSPCDAWPVLVTAGAFAGELPLRNLYLSPDHAVFVDGVLIPIKHLINGCTITRQPRDEVTYWHVELARHDLIFAEGLPCESYLDCGDRSAFENGGLAVQMHADFSARVWEAEGCAPLIVCGPQLEAVRVRLLQRAAALASSRSARKARRRQTT